MTAKSFLIKSEHGQENVRLRASVGTMTTNAKLINFILKREVKDMFYICDGLVTQMRLSVMGW